MDLSSSASLCADDVTVVRAQADAISRPQHFVFQPVQSCSERVDLLLNLAL
jgi:hypothetical protein